MMRSAGFPDTRPSLLDKLGDGGMCQAAWQEFFELYAPAVQNVARHRGLRTHDAEDIVQQVMLAMAQRLDRFRYDRDRGRFRNWVRTITENKISTVTRRNTFASPAPISDEMATPDEIWRQEWQMQDLLWCMEQVRQEVSPKRMSVFELYSLQGLTALEVAQRMNTTEGYVYVTRHLVLGIMRKKLDSLIADE